ncbi:MAG: M3 family metallopeptidase [Bacteroidales bacterium]|jgi:peptidyl-dipeptidase Dcp|nr:M3 family metallopeptidase [Bacteroidales bacterium]
MKIKIMPVIVLSVIGACQTNKKNATDNNPLTQPSTLPYGAPDFTAIKVEHFKPAIEAGIAEKLAEIERIANDSGTPTFANTLIELEKSGQLLNRACGVFELLSGANTSDEIQNIKEELSPKLAALENALFLNGKLFERIKAIYDHRADLDLAPESLRLVEFYYDNFVLQGANIPESDKPEYKALSEEEATLTTRFENRLLAAAKNAAFITDDTTLLRGLSEAELKTLAQNAKNSGKDGQYLIPVQNTTQQPLCRNLASRTTREQLFRRAWTRTEQNDNNDTRKIIARIAQIRARQAQIMGFKNFAEWQLADQMAKTPEAARGLLTRLMPGALQKATREAEKIQQQINSSGNNFQLEAWDWNFYAEQVRQAEFALDENSIKPYFALNTVLEKGVFFAATRLYGITFQERHDIPVYQEDVRVFELFEADKTPIGLFYFDPFKRDNKSGGAWMGNLTEQSYLLGNKPVIYNVCNFVKPAAGQPALLSYDDVTTMFHEFGHALHGFFAAQKYPSLSGTNVARDFVELPSQFNEHWALYPEVFSNYAVHYQTEAQMPDELAQKLKKTTTFNQGYMLTELLAAATLDMEWHTLPADTAIADAVMFEQLALDRTGLNIKTVPPRYRSSYFLHIWGHGYAAGYYAYLWAEMLDNDAYAWFEENGGLTRDNGQRFRDMVLSRGNTADLETLFVKFRGRQPDITPMLKNRGI